MKRLAIISELIFAVLLASGMLACSTSTPTQTTSTESEYYTFVSYADQVSVNLKLVNEWRGTGSTKLSFSVNGVPFLVDYESEGLGQYQVSQWFQMCLERPDGTKIINRFEYPAYPCCAYDIWKSGYWIVNQGGQFVLNINSNECHWRVRVGTVTD